MAQQTCSTFASHLAVRPWSVGLGILLTLAGCKGGGKVQPKAPTPIPSEPQAATLTVTSFEPKAAAPGAALLLRGSRFTQDAQVCFNGTLRVPSQWLSSTLLKVWVPEGAATGSIQVETAAGSATATAPFTVLPSRSAALAMPFVVVPSSNDGRTCKVDFPGPRRTAQYDGLYLPMAPVFHPYHPMDLTDDSLRPGKVASQMNVNLKLPEAFHPVLPDSLKAKLAELALAPGQVDILVVSQDQPWAAPMLFRPHYWLVPEAPSHQADYNVTREVQAGIFEGGADVHFVGHTPGEWVSGSVSVHSAEEHLVVSSPDNLAVAGLNPFHSRAFWTLTQCGPRAAATLHLMFDDADQATLEGLMLRAGNLKQLIHLMEHSPLGATPMTASLKALNRPVITGMRSYRPRRPRKALHQLPPTFTILEILGNGFTGATAVTTSGKPAPQWSVLDDTRMRVVLNNRDANTGVVITTPMGTAGTANLAKAPQ